MKLFYGNQFVRSWYVKAVRITKRTLIVSALMALVGWGMYFGANYFAKTSYAEIQVPVIVESSSTPPVLQRIAKCESHNSQFDKNGQVVIHVNADKTYDIGEYQINSLHEKEATKLGLNLMIEKDNAAYAKFIYANRGTGDWYSSQDCWSK
jgi:hypothetical protein